MGILIVLMCITGLLGMAQETKTTTKSTQTTKTDYSTKKTGKYLIIAPHTEAECTETMEQMSAKETKALNNAYFGCKHGDHTAYLIVDAKSESDALGMVPEEVSKNAKVVRVDKMTRNDLKTMHKTDRSKM